MTNKVKVALWLPKKLKERLRKTAKAQHRTMSNMNEVILRDYLETRNKGV